MKKYCIIVCIFLISIVMVQCMKHCIGVLSANNDILEIEYNAFDATNCNAIITYENDSAIIIFENEELVFSDNYDVENRIKHVIPVEKPISDTIVKLALGLFVSKSVPIYVYYEYDQELPIFEDDAGWITVRTGSQDTIIEINDFYTTMIHTTSDQHYYMYSKQFKMLMQYIEFVMYRFYGGIYYDDYIRELNERRNDSTKEVFIPDSIK